MTADRAPADFGRKLREARERRGISLRQIANTTKISVSALEALERNAISRLPGGIFSRAFVRSYAVEVGLDPEETIREFIAQFPQDSVTAGHPKAEPVEDNDAIEGDRRMATTFLRMALLSVPLAGIVLYIGMAGRSVTPPPQKSLALAAAAPEPAPEAPPLPPVAEKAAVLQPPQAPVDRLTTRQAPADRLTAPQPPVDRPITAPPPTDRSTSPQPPPDRFVIALSARGPCWVSATVDGEKTFEQLMEAGDHRTIEGIEVMLTIGDASAITMTLNGAEAKSLGKAGEAVTRRFNVTNLKEYLSAQ